MSNTKYKIRKDLSIEFEGHILYRIEATRNIDCDIVKGDLGGYIEERYNLSPYDNCWIYDNAKVFDRARVINNALIMDDAVVKNHALVCDNAMVTGDSVVYNGSIIRNDVKIFNHAKVCDNSIIEDRAVIRDKAVIQHRSLIKNDAVVAGYSIVDHAIILGDAFIGKNMKINDTNDVIVVGPIGSRNAFTTFIRQPKNIYVSCGCFFDTIDKFEKAVTNRHAHLSDNKYYYAYMNVIEYIKKQFAIYKKEGE